MEDYQRLQEAAEKGDAEAVESASKALETSVRGFAKSMAGKYLSPPHTTDFALLYLPSESLYAEVLRRRGMVESMQRDHRVVITGPSSLAALLNSLQMGFRTLAIQQKSAEVWNVLGAVKTEFGRFSDVLAKVKKKLDEASNQIEETGVRTRAIARKLKEVEALPEADAQRLLPPVPALLEEETV
jgi:DNA recombination protein RmuC